MCRSVGAPPVSNKKTKACLLPPSALILQIRGESFSLQNGKRQLGDEDIEYAKCIGREFCQYDIEHPNDGESYRWISCGSSYYGFITLVWNVLEAGNQEGKTALNIVILTL